MLIILVLKISMDLFPIVFVSSLFNSLFSSKKKRDQVQERGFQVYDNN